MPQVLLHSIVSRRSCTNQSNLIFFYIYPRTLKSICVVPPQSQVTSKNPSKKSHPPPQESFTCGYGRIRTLHLSSKWGGKRAEAAVAALGMAHGPQCHSRLGAEFSGGHRGRRDERWQAGARGCRPHLLESFLRGRNSRDCACAVRLAAARLFSTLSAVNPALVQKFPPKKLLNKVELPDKVQ